MRSERGRRATQLLLVVEVAVARAEVEHRVGERVEIVSGLLPSARVVAAGAGFLADGDVVDGFRINIDAATIASGDKFMLVEDTLDADNGEIGLVFQAMVKSTTLGGPDLPLTSATGKANLDDIARGLSPFAEIGRAHV